MCQGKAQLPLLQVTKCSVRWHLCRTLPGSGPCPGLWYLMQASKLTGDSCIVEMLKAGLVDQM